MTEWDNDRQKRFWKACGFVEMRFNDKPDEPSLLYKYPSSSSVGVALLPHITDLNALFKYAVPKVAELLDLDSIEFDIVQGYVRINYWQHTGNEEADNYLYNYEGESLAEAIEKVIK